MRAATAAIVVGLLGAGLVGAACRSPASTSTGADAADATALPVVIDARASVDTGAAATLPPTRVHEVLTAWLGSQNTGDFAAYEALYASHVDALVHDGPRRWRFDRKAWIAIRGRVFRRPMEVGMTDLRVEVGRGSAVVTFAQTLHQGRLREDGVVQLVLVVEGEAVRIAREEMIAAAPPAPPSAKGVRRRGRGRPAPPPAVVEAPKPPPRAASPLRLVLDVDGAPYVVVAARADGAWGTGAPRLASAPPAGASHAALRAASPPAELTTWRGRSVALLDAGGQRCDATIGELALLTAATLPAQEVAAWTPPGGNAASPAEIADIVQRLGGPPTLVGRLDGATCKPVIAMITEAGAAAAPTSPTLLAAAHDAPVEARAVTAVRATPAYQRVQQAYARETHRAGAWGTARASVYALGDRRFVSVEVAPGGAPAAASASPAATCGAFDAHLWALYEIDRSGLHLRNDPSADGFAPALFIDSGGDTGGLHLVGRDGAAAAIRALTATGVQPAAQLALPYLATDC